MQSKHDVAPEEQKSEVDTSRALSLLNTYAAAKDQEKFGMKLARVYNRRRQAAYREYLKEYDMIRRDPGFNNKMQEMFNEKLEEIQKRNLIMG